MDGRRIAEEDMRGMGYELVELKWYEKSITETVLRLVTGKKAVGDIVLPGVDFQSDAFCALHYPLTLKEIDRYRWLGRKMEEIFRKVADEIRAGQTEKEIEAMFISYAAADGIREIVGIIGSDDRISKYRHCVASDKKVEKLVLLAPAVKKWGLTLPITRIVCLDGHVPNETAHKYDAACRIEAQTMAMCRAGARFTEILQAQKDQYRTTGYPEEWRNHFQGGITGYIVNDATKCMDTASVICDCQTFNWYITITGVKVEETVLSTSEGVEILTSTGLWPVKRYEADGKAFDLPQILVK
jgi:hypothetical protein